MKERKAPSGGDTLCYSAAAGDINGDGRADIIVNEMAGNGIGPGTTDVGHLLLTSGTTLLSPVPCITGVERVGADGLDIRIHFQSHDTEIYRL